MLRAWAPRGAAAAPARGLAALAIVMVLFFVMALVAAYANRNLLIEQRLATNSYRGERALAAASAGLDWALALLNSGRIDSSCQPTMTATEPGLRERMLARGLVGGYEPTSTATPDVLVAPACAMVGGALTCVCPTTADPEPTTHAVRDWTGTGLASAFRVRVGGTSMAAGTVPLEILGCGSPGHGPTSCADPGDVKEVDGLAVVRATVGMVRALPNVPPAALTAGGGVTGGILRVTNPDSATGMTVHAGGTIAVDGASMAMGPAGSIGDGTAASDAALAALRPSDASLLFGAQDTLFRSTFGLTAPMYRRQPAVVRIDCRTGCQTTDLDHAVQRYPGLTLWFDGALTLATASTLAQFGSPAVPVMMIVTGALTVQTPVQFTGFAYARSIQWTAGATGGVVTGSWMAAEDVVLDAGATATFVYDGEAMRNIQYYYGSFVVAPGGWEKTTE